MYQVNNLLKEHKAGQMKQSILIATVAAVVCSAGFCVGQEGTGSATALPVNQQQLKALAYFLGNWELTGEINMAGQPTIPFVNERTFQWDLGKNFIHTTTIQMMEGRAELRHRSVIGWEPKTQRITEWGFWNLNLPDKPAALTETVTWVKDGEKWRIEKEGVNGLFTIIDQNTHKYECTFKGDDGSDNSWHYTATRKTATKQAVSPVYEHLKDLEDFIGNWIVENTLSEDVPELGKKGDKVIYRLVMSWAQNKSVMQMNFTTTGADGKTTPERWMFGWDAVNKEIVYSGFGGLGGRVWGTAKKESPDKWVLETHWSDADGKQGTVKDSTTMLNNNSTHLHEYTNAVFDGNPLPDWKLEFKRVK